MSDGQIVSSDGIADLLSDFERRGLGNEFTAEAGNFSHIGGSDNISDNGRNYSWDNGESDLGHSEQIDAEGTVFDPAIHSIRRDGSPSITKTGKFRRRKGADKIQSPQGPRSQINIPGAGTLDLDEPSPLAKTAALGYIQTGVTLFGPEWLPDAAKKEQEFLTHAFHEFFEAHEMDDLPPGLALAVACFAYAAPRFYQPQTQSRLGQFWRATKAAVAHTYIRVRYGTRFNNRTDAVRKNDTGAQDVRRGGIFRRAFAGT